MSSEMKMYNSTPEMDQILTTDKIVAEIAINETIQNVVRQSEDSEYILYLNNIVTNMWIYAAPILFFMGTTGNVTSAIIMLRYVEGGSTRSLSFWFSSFPEFLKELENFWLCYINLCII